MAKKYAAEYLGAAQAAKTRVDLSDAAKALLDALSLVLNGNIVWSLQCPRFHPDQELSPKQLAMAREVLADDFVGWKHGQQRAASGEGLFANVGSNGVVQRTVVVDAAADKGTACQRTAVAREVPALGTETLEAPSRYIDSLPAKGIRDRAIDALNIWFKVPPTETVAIKKAVNLLHGASLMLDDIEDSSQLRRGKPAAHIVFGSTQTINSTGYRFLGALVEVRKLNNERCMTVLCEELRDLYIGQSHDVSWTQNLSCPTEEEYLAMVDGKTSGLFRMLARLLDAVSNSPTKPDVTLLTRFMTLLGRMFQIRDDYMNLTSEDYTKQKGFCEDLDEGKYSLPLIHALGRCNDPNTPKPDAQETTILRNMLSQRHVAGRMTLDQKKLFLEHLKARGSLEYTRQAIDELQAAMRRLLEQMGMLNDDPDNDRLKELLKALKV